MMEGSCDIGNNVEAGVGYRNADSRHWKGASGSRVQREGPLQAFNACGGVTWLKCLILTDIGYIFLRYSFARKTRIQRIVDKPERPSQTDGLTYGT